MKVSQKIKIIFKNMHILDLQYDRKKIHMMTSII